MLQKLINFFNPVEQVVFPQEFNLVAEIQTAKAELQRLEDNFGHLSDQQDIDLYGYQILAVEVRLNHLIRQAKESRGEVGARKIWPWQAKEAK